MSTAGTIIRGEGEGERLWFAGGGLWTMKATAEETDEAFILIEDRMTRGKMTPLHTHPKQDETLIVLEGEILVYAEGREHRVGPRGVVVAPRGVPHAFMVTSERALILTLQTPGSGEAFYRDASEPSTEDLYDVGVTLGSCPEAIQVRWSLRVGLVSRRFAYISVEGLAASRGLQEEN